MEPLRLRRADSAPGLGAAEYFGQVPSSVVTDRELSDGAVRAYAAVKLAMAEAGNRTLCLAPMRELGRLMGVTEREARYRIAELESRGHVVRERARSIAGSPQGIRPLAATRTRNNRSDGRNDHSDCNRNDHSTHPERTFRGPGTNDPPDRNDRSGPLKREGEREEEQQQNGGPAAVVVALSRSEGEQNADADAPSAPALSDFLGSLAGSLARSLDARRPETTPGAARKKGAGAIRQDSPGAEAGNSIPDPQSLPRATGNRQDMNPKGTIRPKHRPTS